MCAPELPVSSPPPQLDVLSFQLSPPSQSAEGRKERPSAYPELHQEEGVRGPPFKQLLEATLLLWEFVIDLADVHGFEVGVIVAWARLADVHKQVLAVL